MKTIKNKKTTLPDGEGKELDYKQLISFCIKEQKQEGFNLDDMRKRLKILDIIEASNGIINLEDADYTLVKEIIEKKRWPVLDKQVVQFVDDILAAK